MLLWSLLANSDHNHNWNAGSAPDPHNYGNTPIRSHCQWHNSSTSAGIIHLLRRAVLSLSLSSVRFMDLLFILHFKVVISRMPFSRSACFFSPCAPNTPPHFVNATYVATLPLTYSSMNILRQCYWQRTNIMTTCTVFANSHNFGNVNNRDYH